MGELVLPLRLPMWKRAIPVVVLSLAISALAGFTVWSLRPPSLANVIRFPFLLPDGQQFSGQTRSILALSPDGMRMVYGADQRLYLRSMYELDAHPIPGTDLGAAQYSPAFSPDGSALAFYTLSDGTLRRIAAAGGTPVTICKIDQPFGVTWGPKDEILIGYGNRGILRVPAKGGNPETILSVKSSELAY